MFSNYLKVTLRNLLKYRAYAAINILGLAIGMACCLLIMLWVTHKLSFDRYHEHKDRIYRVCVDLEAGSHMRWVMTMPSLAPAIIRDYPEVRNAVRLDRPHSASVQYRNKLIQEENICYADNSLFEIFNFPLLRGDAENALTAPYSVVLTEDMAEKYFADEDALGKMLKIGGDFEYMVTGICKNVPDNSHFIFNMACSYETLYAMDRAAMENWFHIQFYTYLLLEENVDASQFEQKLPAFVDTYMGDLLNSIGGKLDLFLQPLTKIHLFSTIGGEIAPQSSITFVYIFSCIALFILFIACFNFVNLSTARSVTRTQEVGLRKTLGAQRGGLIAQFIGESIFYCVLALLSALILLFTALPLCNTLFESNLSLRALADPLVVLGLLAFAFLVGILAGAYPAFFLSSFRPARIFRGSTDGSGSVYFRHFLVILQFIISITLIIGTLTIYHQLRFMKNKELGFVKEQVLVIPSARDLLRRVSYETVQQKLLQVPGVLDVGGSSLVPSAGVQKGIFFPEGFSENEPQTTNRLHVDARFIPTLGIKITRGRNFSEDISTDRSSALIISEAAARQFGWSEPLGKKFIFRPSPGEAGETVYMTVIGVIQDFHSLSLRNPIEPLVLYNDPDGINFIVLKLAAATASADWTLKSTVDTIEKTWAEIDPDRPFRYFFLDESFDALYRGDNKLAKIILSFSLLAIFIGCLGLLGLAAFSAEKRTKEIGIRKALGATVSGIVLSLIKQFTVMVMLAALFAWPISYLAVQKWLQSFAYRIEIHFGIFLLAGIFALTTAVCTVCYQALKAATANPVDALRYE